jgi:hypothetical protein
MSSSAKVCHVCHSGYRGLYMLHVSTKYRRSSYPRYAPEPGRYVTPYRRG